MALRPYNRRSSPEEYKKAFWDLETANIKAAIADAQSGASGVAAGTYGDATHVPQVTVDASGRVTAASNVAIASSSSPIFLTADVSNSSSAINQASGLKANVVAGSTYTFRWYLVFNSNANTGGVSAIITHGTYTAAITHTRGNTTGVATLTDTIVTVTTSPLTIATYVSYSGVGIIMIDHTLVASASGTVEFAFHPATNTQNYTLKAGSYLQVFGPA